MATNWERIDSTENGPDFKQWLKNRLVAEEEVNKFSFEEINQYRTEFERQQQANGEPRPQRQKNLANLISNNWQMAVWELKKLLEPHIEADSADPATYCIPKRIKTWNAEQMAFQLRRIRDTLSTRLVNFNPVKREKVVIGIRLGTGCGKTHALVEAGRCLSTFPLLYVTYNQSQILINDGQHPRKALLIRLILAIAGSSSASTGGFLDSAESQVCFEAGVTLEKLRDLFVSYAKEEAKSNDIVIGVDETNNLSTPAAKAVISELGYVASRYKKKTGSMCTVLVTSLIWEHFRAESDRSVEIWTPTIPDETTIEYFSQGKFKGYTRKEVAAVLTAVGGHHMRSLVVARQIMKDGGVAATVQGVYKKMKSRLGITLDEQVPRTIQHYVRNSIEKRYDEHKPDPSLQPFMDNFGAIAPTLILLAFSLGESASGLMEDLLEDSQDSLVADSRQVERPPEHPARSPLLGLFDSATIFLDAPKQLEEMAKQYDFFRQKMSLPVVPANATIKFPNNGEFQSEEWYRELVFPSEMQENMRSLLKLEKDSGAACAAGSREEAKDKKTTKPQTQCQKTTEPKAKEKTVYTGVKMKLGDYFHPKETNHPWIDRAFLAKAAGSARCCLVLAQDKVNEDDFGKAVKLLNKAADLLSEKTGFRDVLCIANVIGASSKTRAQSNFTTPYILVRNDEVKDFFSVNFAVPVLFSRKRHLLQYKKEGGMQSGSSV